MNFEEKLIELRKKKGISQENLADKLGVARQTISKWELGDTTPDMDNLMKISNIFDISIDELVGKENIESYTKGKKNNNKKKIILIIMLLIIIVFGIIFGRRTILILKLYSNINKLESDKFIYSSEININNEKVLISEIEYINGETLNTNLAKENGQYMSGTMQYENSNTGEVYYLTGYNEDGNISDDGEKIKYINYQEYVSKTCIKDNILNILEMMEMNKKNLIFDLSIKIEKNYEDNSIIIKSDTERYNVYLIFNIEESIGNVLVKGSDNILNENSITEYNYEIISDGSLYADDDLSLDMDTSNFKIVDWTEENY